MVAALVLSRLASIAEHYLAPRFAINGTKVVMDMFNLATLPADRLGAPVASLADEVSRSRFIRVLDEFVSRA